MAATVDNKQKPRPPYDLTRAAADYPKWQGPPDKTLLICSQQRSGSTLLGEAIYFAGGLGCPLEYFHAGFRPGFEQRWNAGDFDSYAAGVHRLRTDPSGTLSVKLFWLDVIDILRACAPDEFRDLTWRTATVLAPEVHRRIWLTVSKLFPNPSFVFLQRRDQMRQAVSYFRAARTRKWRKYPDEDQDAAATGDYNFDRIVQMLAIIQAHNVHWRDFFRANGFSYYEMDYEDLEQAYEPTLKKLFAALGRPDAKIQPPRLQKQADEISEQFLQQFLADFRQRASG